MALAAYRAQDWSGAREKFTRVRELADGKLDLLHAMFMARLDHLATQPPGEDWDTVFQATTK